MGRKHRSSSLSSSIKPRSTSISSPSVEVDIDSATTLFNHFLHEKDSIGRTFLHHAISVVADSHQNQDRHEKSNSREDGYALISGVCERAKELDKIRVRQNTNASAGSGTHLHKLMLTRDEENGYTPLHSAIVRRDLTSLLILLKQASMENDGEESNINCGHSMAHPLRLLGQTEGTRVMKDLAGALDNEGLSPLRLLGATSEGELEKCRETMHWSYLKQIWKRSQPCNAEVNPRRGRQRMVSFGDERDYLNNDVEASVVLDRRSRSGSFHVDDLDEEDEDEQQQAADVDLLPLGEVDFTLLVEPADARRQSEEQVLCVDGASVDYGCELYTFGRADHCALGVPQFGTGGRRDKLFDDSFERNAQDHSSCASHKPRRVEAFALGDMRRDWSSSSNDKDAVDSPVVAVAAIGFKP